MGFNKKNLLNFGRASPLDKLNKTREKLEKKENHFKEKASQEVAKAKEFARAEDETAAIRCLMTKKLREQKIKELEGFKFRIDNQAIMLEGAKATTETVDALGAAAAAMNAMCIPDVDNVMCGVDEQNESVQQMIEAVLVPSGALALFDEDELKKELAELKCAE